MAESNDRVMHQYGWLTGPVECRCSHCSWGASFLATGSGTPKSIARTFEEHDCSEFYVPGEIRSQEANNIHEKEPPKF